MSEEGAASSKLLVFLDYKERLASLLEQFDLQKLSADFLRYRIVSNVMKTAFTSLDRNHLDPGIQVRYLLNQVCERVREDGQVFDRLVRALSRLEGGVKGVCEAMRKELDGFEGRVSSGEIGGDVPLTKRDIPVLTESMVSCAYKWEEISIALGLPKHVRDECTYGTSHIFNLNKILTVWISGGYLGFRSATLGNLKKALASETVGLHRVSQHLSTIKRPVDPFPMVKKARLNNRPQIHLQSCDTEVAEGKSTLLEVQVSSSGYESYQWRKDGHPVHDGSDFSGVSSNMLYIDGARQATEGKYSCSVSNGIETVCSKEISLVVIYPPNEHLVQLYSLMGSGVHNSWPPVGNSTFIDIVLIKHSPISRCDYYTVRGDMDDILMSKEVVKYEEVFREYREGALVLVEGRPGSGKTTLVHKVTRDWARGRILQGARMVFLINLKIWSVLGKDRSLLEILHLLYGYEVSKMNIEHELQECGGKGSCFIIDGLDEYQHTNKKESVIYQLIYKHYLPYAMVIVSSRPVATFSLKNKCTKRIEVVGFTKSQINAYLETYPFDRFDAGSKLKVYLDQHPNILHMCYLPVHAAMICFLFSQLEGNIPHTETQIYEHFTKTAILRHMMRAERQVQLVCLQDLCDEEKVQFRSICKLAFEMTFNFKEVVSQSDAQVSLLESSSSVLGLLTVEPTARLYGLEHRYSFHHLTFQEFLAAYHITRLEEHEQNCIITKYSRDYKLQNVWKFYCGLVGLEHEGNTQNVLGSIQVLSSYQVQCAFESQQVELCDYVVGDGSLKLSEFITASDFAALGYVISTASQLDYKLCFDRCTWDYGGVMALSTWITNERLQSIKLLRVSVNDSDEDFKAVNGLLSQLPFLEELDFCNKKLDKHGIECLTRNITLLQLQVLKIRLPLQPCSNPEEALLTLKSSFPNIKQIYFSSSGLFSYNNIAMWRKCLCYAFGFQVFQDSDISWIHLYNSDEFFSSLPQERFSYCSEVVLVNCGIDDEGAEILANRLNTSVLENFVLDFNRISDAGAVALAGCMARCSVVQEVSIQCNSIGDSGAIALADALVHCSSLRRLDLQGNGLGDEGAVAIAKAAQGLPNLDLYLHNVNITEEGVERVLEHRASTKIRAMVFGSSWDAISDAGIDALRSALKCGTLSALKISETNIYNIGILVAELEHVRNIRGLECYRVTDNTVPNVCGIIKSLTHLQNIRLVAVSDSILTSPLFCDSLKFCRYLCGVSLCGRDTGALLQYSLLNNFALRLMNVSDYYIGSEGVVSLFCDRTSWVNLHTLNLCNNNIGSDGAIVLGIVLAHCKSLRCLVLSRNYIGDTGAVALAEGLKDHTTLLELDLGRNGITSKGILALVQIIRSNHLQHLDLSNNSEVTEGVVALVDVLCGDALQALNLGGNGLGLDSAVSVSAGIRSCTQLAKLDLSDNNIGSHGMSSLAEGLESCSQLLELNISDNSIGSCGMSSLAEGLLYCVNLQVLGLRNNKITSDSVAAIVGVMERCRYLEVLYLGFNGIGVDGAAVLVGGWHNNTMLRIDLESSLGKDHESALVDGERCCSSCDHLLGLYYYNDHIVLEVQCDVFVPKLVL